MKVISIPHPALTKKSKAALLEPELVKFIVQLEKTLRYKKNPAGVGLSAPQVAKNWRLFSLYLDHSNPESIKTYINPKFVDRSDSLTLSEDDKGPLLEGCLSIPRIYAPVYRFEWVELEYDYWDPAANKFVHTQEKFVDYPARVVQHEYDHLEGVLFTQRALEQGLELYEETGDKLIPLSTSARK